MNKPTPQQHDIARRVMLAQEPAATSLDAAATAVQLSCGELYRVLETAMGPAGLQALIARAIQITTREYPWLASVKVGTTYDCALSGLAESAKGLSVTDANEGYAALLASIMWLLITFIGEELTLRFLRQAWPKVSLSKLSEGRQ